MKHLKIILLILISLSIFACGNKKIETNTKTTENTQQKQSTNTGKTDNQIAVIKNVENSSAKNIAPVFSWTENGTEKSTKDLKGKVLFVNFWATWCAPCKKEMPDLSLLSEELKSKDFQMLGLCVAEGNDVSKIAEVLKAIPVSYTIIQGNDNLVSAFKAASGNDMQAVPTSFIIDKSGKIVETIVGSRSKQYFTDKINEYLK